jgi:hypothetical protein
MHYLKPSIIMKKILTLAFLFAGLVNLKAQQIVDLEENKTYTYNGIDYGYYITNEGTKEVKGESYDRYEINLYVTNKSGCMKLFPLRLGAIGGQANNNESYTVAEFNCKNATGKRLTAKSGKVAALPWFTQVKVDANVAPGANNGIVQALVGYAIKPAQTLTQRIIVIVPKGERPKFTCRIVYIPEMM